MNGWDIRSGPEELRKRSDEDCRERADIDHLRTSLAERGVVLKSETLDSEAVTKGVHCGESSFFYNIFAAAISSGAVTGAYHLVKTWVDARNGRKLKIKVGDIEVEATQMTEQEVLSIFGLLEEKADRKKIRELLIATSHGKPPQK